MEIKQLKLNENGPLAIWCYLRVCLWNTVLPTSFSEFSSIRDNAVAIETLKLASTTLKGGISERTAFTGDYTSLWLEEEEVEAD